ncbi:hypothetical protein LX36DRAFT_173843 [Colletotrichum falcatum]|nr:hypothetical protein LX36DRAFT_173843 [Colletotrichum falcatum]
MKDGGGVFNFHNPGCCSPLFFSFLFFLSSPSITVGEEVSVRISSSCLCEVILLGGPGETRDGNLRNRPEGGSLRAGQLSVRDGSASSNVSTLELPGSSFWRWWAPGGGGGAVDICLVDEAP